MNKAKRQAVIAGNWKMNKTRPEAKALIEQIKPLVRMRTAALWSASPIPIWRLRWRRRKAQYQSGCGELPLGKIRRFYRRISADMLAEMGVEYVVIGHSERRQYFGETDKTVNQRVRAALDAGLKVILCVGELLEQREQGITEEVCGMQTKVALCGVSKEELSHIIIAYEPVWAIGTGKTATAEQADEENGFIRSVVAGLYGEDAAQALTIQYGGSMNAKNAEELLSKEHVDGGLIGGASLKAEDFSIIVKAASK